MCLLWIANDGVLTCPTDNNCLKVLEGLEDEQVLFLSDILPTGWHAIELACVGEGDNVGI
jgi:threonine dehydrogenase-like Zn-dependent dehydrogenase